MLPNYESATYHTHKEREREGEREREREREEGSTEGGSIQPE